MNTTLAEVLSSTPLFNKTWYLNTNQDVMKSGINPLHHFLNFGMQEGRSPNPLFLPHWYIAQCGSTGSMAPFEHYFTVGSRHNFDPHPLFSLQYFKQQVHADWNTIDPLLYYLAGDGSGASPHPLFNVDWYIAGSDYAPSIGLSPLEHFILYGWKSYFDPHPLFSIAHYIKQVPELLKIDTNPLLHYITTSTEKDNSPHPLFLSHWYLQQYPELPSNINPLVHYIQTGWRQGRKPHPLFDPEWYRKQFMPAEAPTSSPLEHFVRSNREAFSGVKPDHIKQYLLQQAIFAFDNTSNVVAFIVYNDDCISGGIFSIFSLAAEIRKIGKNVSIYTMPGDIDVVFYSRFLNNETLLPFHKLTQHIEEGRITTINVPEVLCSQLLQELTIRNIDTSQVHMNILNQNEELMPSKKTVDWIKSTHKSVTMTTAHLKYSTQLHSDKWQVPLKHVSTYMSHTDYNIVPFEQKVPLFLLSPDRCPRDYNLVEFLFASFPCYNFFRIENLHYELYKYTLLSTRFMLTLGEGLDNYFIETFFTGGFAFTVYNPRFMPQRMKFLDNVFSSLRDLKCSISSVIRDIEIDSGYRNDLFRQNYDFLSEIYDKSIYITKVREFLDGEFDFYPAQNISKTTSTPQT